ncbi:hypothetical protein N7516_004746, partial [Penicillium verrucosum]|uniref:uncharacterized protein n=1 Tax=Penicillium verrucosum TaxID=60171 RepID=UPI002545A58C
SQRKSYIFRDFLSKDLPQYRTIIYGYNSKLSSYKVDTILDYGRELIEEIKKVRNIKEIIEEDHPAITSLYRATYSIILFTILYKGLGTKAIRESDYYSRSLLADFKNLIRDRKVLNSIRVTRPGIERRSINYVPFKKDPMFIGREAIISSYRVFLLYTRIYTGHQYGAVGIRLLADYYSYGDSRTGRSED